MGFGKYGVKNMPKRTRATAGKASSSISFAELFNTEELKPRINIIHKSARKKRLSIFKVFDMCFSPPINIW